MSRIKVTLTVTINGEDKQFVVDAETTADVHDVAIGNLKGIANAGLDWLHDRKQEIEFPSIPVRNGYVRGS